jgi:AcrR family transcriptional regulator
VSVLAADDHRRGPRRRGAALEEAIIAAAVAELAEVGLERLSMERVAERARTGKASVYRRWPNRLELAVAAFYRLAPDRGAASDTGTLRGDLLAFFGAEVDTLAGPAGTVLRAVLADVVRDRDLGDRFRAATRGSGAEVMAGIVRRAQGRGELGPAPVTAWQLEAGLAVVRFQGLTSAQIEAADIAEIVDQVVIPLLRAAGSRPDGTVGS